MRHICLVCTPCARAQITIHTGDAWGHGCAPAGACLVWEVLGSEGGLSSAQCTLLPAPPDLAPADVAARRQAAVEFALGQAGLLRPKDKVRARGRCGSVRVHRRGARARISACASAPNALHAQAPRPAVPAPVDRDIFGLLRHHSKHNRAQVQAPAVNAQHARTHTTPHALPAAHPLQATV